MGPSKTIEICFVCLGNICRSPLAEGVFQHLVNSQKLQEKIIIDSAGTGNWHVGSPPDRRMESTARKKGVRLTSIAQQFQPGDFRRFDLVIAMDRSNLQSLEYMCPPEVAGQKLKLFRSFDPQANGDLDVPDPYYGGQSGFEDVFEIVNRTCPQILEYIKTRF
ncbi:low molecular weight protein-tyrosine-phosphatase [Nitrospina sp. 32_T5]|uniref:low molecular weight protein-tyrosine-phosphatase n=1 Tax=unclassified Nitrospina TaxID=2638683 RepID=UPI003F98B9A7